MPSRFHLLFLICVAFSASVTAAPRVMVSILPLHSLVANVMRDVADPGLLIRHQQSPHAFTLRPSDARLLHDADVIFWVGPELERPLERILATGVRARSVALIATPGLTLLPPRHLHDHDLDASSAHTDGAVDPHIWLSPANAVAMTLHIAAVLGDIDPQNARHYEANAARAREELLALDQTLFDQLHGLTRRYAVFHDAYQYLEHRYGLHPLTAITSHPERRPGAAHLSELNAQLSEHDVRCLFSEPQFDSRLIARLSEGRDVRHSVLDPLGSHLVPGPHAYDELMHQLAAGFSRCLGEDK